MNPRQTLILGGVRSGKSRLAESLAAASGQSVHYLATATAGDDEMRDRIQHHQAQRPAHWILIEEPLHLADALRKHARPDTCLLVDCLTLWLTNLLLVGEPSLLDHERDALLAVLPELPGRLLLVSNETGLGIMPLGDLTRRFGDEAGRLHQHLAMACDQVILTVAGLPLYLKGTPA